MKKSSSKLHIHNKIIAITGLTGVGKDFLAMHAIQNLDINLVNWGTILSDRLGVRPDEMMETVNPKAVKRQQFTTCDTLVDSQPVVVTCHTVRSRGLSIEYDMGLERRLNPSVYVFISAPAALIQGRVVARNLSGTRVSQVLSLSHIEKLQQIKKDRVIAIADELNSLFIEINNEDDLIEENICKLIYIIGLITSERVGVDPLTPSEVDLF